MEIEVTNETCHLTQSRCTDTGSTSPRHTYSENCRCCPMEIMKLDIYHSQGELTPGQPVLGIPTQRIVGVAPWR